MFRFIGGIVFLAFILSFFNGNSTKVTPLSLEERVESYTANQAKRRVLKLTSELKSIPAANTHENLIRYKELALIDPEVKKYHAKISFYTKQAKKDKIVAKNYSQKNKQKEISLASQYPGPWQTNFHLDISKSLASNDISGCGEFKYKKSKNNKGEFLVYCTRDGYNWVAYLVFVAIKEVMGPYNPDPNLN